MMAAGLRRPTMVELLLPAGADPTLKDKQGKKGVGLRDSGAARRVARAMH